MAQSIMLLSRFAIVTSVLMSTALASANEAQSIKLTRPEAVGDTYRVKASGSIQNALVFKGDGKETSRQQQSLQTELVGDVKVLEVSPNGASTKLSLTVKKLEQTSEGKKRSLLPEGTVVTLGRQGQTPTYQTESGPVANEVAAALVTVIQASDSQGPTDDETFGAKEPKKVGESWPASKEALLKGFERIGPGFDQASLDGKATLVEVKSVGTTPCTVVRYEATARPDPSKPLQGMPNWAKVTGGQMSIVGSKTSPVDPKQRALTETAEMSMNLKAGGTAPNGAKVEMEMSSTGTRQANYEPLK